MHVEFESYVDNEEGSFIPDNEPNRHPYDRGTSSVITLDDDKLLGDEDRVRLKLTVNPETKTIKQRITTPEGSQKKLSDDDRKAIRKAGELLSELLDRKGRGDCNMKNQETLILRHFALLSETGNETELNDYDRTYDYTGGCRSNQNSSTTNLSTAGGFFTNLSTKGTLGAERCAATNASQRGAASASLVGRSEPAAQTYFLQYIDPGEDEDGVVPLDCYGTDNYATYDSFDAELGTYPITAGEATGDDHGRCGFPGTSFQFSYTQDCLDHDECVYQAGHANCVDELFAVQDDLVLGPGYDYCQEEQATTSSQQELVRRYGPAGARDPAIVAA